MITNRLKLKTLPVLGTSYAIAKLAPAGKKEYAEKYEEQGMK